jgi:hypothetical protein
MDFDRSDRARRDRVRDDRQHLSHLGSTVAEYLCRRSDGHDPPELDGRLAAGYSAPGHPRPRVTGGDTAAGGRTIAELAHGLLNRKRTPVALKRYAIGTGTRLTDSAGHPQRPPPEGCREGS